MGAHRAHLLVFAITGRDFIACQHHRVQGRGVERRMTWQVQKVFEMKRLVADGRGRVLAQPVEHHEFAYAWCVHHQEAAQRRGTVHSKTAIGQG